MQAQALQRIHPRPRNVAKHGMQILIEVELLRTTTRAPSNNWSLFYTKIKQNLRSTITVISTGKSNIAKDTCHAPGHPLARARTPPGWPGALRSVRCTELRRRSPPSRSGTATPRSACAPKSGRSSRCWRARRRWPGRHVAGTEWSVSVVNFRGGCLTCSFVIVNDKRFLRRALCCETSLDVSSKRCSYAFQLIPVS